MEGIFLTSGNDGKAEEVREVLPSSELLKLTTRKGKQDGGYAALNALGRSDVWQENKLVGITCKDGNKGNTMVMTGSQRRKGRRVITQHEDQAHLPKGRCG